MSHWACGEPADEVVSQVMNLVLDSNMGLGKLMYFRNPAAAFAHASEITWEGYYASTFTSHSVKESDHYSIPYSLIYLESLAMPRPCILIMTSLLVIEICVYKCRDTFGVSHTYFIYVRTMMFLSCPVESVLYRRLHCTRISLTELTFYS